MQLQEPRGPVPQNSSPSFLPPVRTQNISECAIFPILPAHFGKSAGSYSRTRVIVQSCCSKDSTAMHTEQHRDSQHVPCKSLLRTCLDCASPAPLRYNQTKTVSG